MALARRVRFAEPLLSSVFEVPSFLARLAEVKLREETSSHEPSLRRCLGHRGVFQKCLNATQEITESSAASDEPPEAPPKSPLRRQSAPETNPIRSNITSAIKEIISRRASVPPSQSMPAPEPEHNELSRVQARSAPDSSQIPRRHKAAPKIFFGLNPFARYRHKMFDKAIC